eukprot:231118-Chlamydomonas_euryale.AAC.4
MTWGSRCGAQCSRCGAGDVRLKVRGCEAQGVELPPRQHAWSSTPGGTDKCTYGCNAGVMLWQHSSRDTFQGRAMPIKGGGVHGRGEGRRVRPSWSAHCHRRCCQLPCQMVATPN